MKEKENNALIIFGLVIGVLLISIAMISIFLIALDTPINNELNKIENQQTFKPIPVIADNLNLIVYDIKKEKDSIKGKIKNTTDKTIEFVEVRGFFYNKEGERVANDFDLTPNLKPGEVFNFEMFVVVEYDNVKFEVGTDLLE